MGTAVENFAENQNGAAGHHRKGAPDSSTRRLWRSPISLEGTSTEGHAAASTAEHSHGTSASGATGLTGFSRLARAQGQRVVMQLQRSLGNTAVQRLLSGTVQRHTTEVLDEEENAVQRVATAPQTLQRDLASELSDAMSGLGTDEAAIFTALDAATPDAKRAVLNNRQVMADLRDELSGTDLGKAMVKLGVPLADQIDYAIAGAGTDEGALFLAIESASTPDDQRALVRSNSALMLRLRDDLSQVDAGRAMRGLKASLTEQLNAAVEGGGTDEAGIISAINAASADQKAAALSDRALMTKLADDQSTSEMLATLKALGASLADRLNMAMDGLGTDEDAIYKIAEDAGAAQRQEILNNFALMARLRDELEPPEMLRALTTLGGSLADMVVLLLSNPSETWRISPMLKAADAVQQTRVKENTALLARMQAALPADSYADVCEALAIPVPAVPVGGAGMPAGAVPGAGATGTAGVPVPPAPTTLVGKVSAALDASPVDGAAAVAAVSAADASERASVSDDTALRNRLFAALSQPQLFQVMTDFGTVINSRVSTLLDRSALVLDIQAHLVAATADEKRAVLKDRVLVERLVAYAGELQRDALLDALGDDLTNRIGQLLVDSPTTAALWTMIRAAAEPARQAVSANTTLMNRIRAAMTAHAFLQTQILLIYGSEGTYPGQVVALLAGLAGSPTLAGVRTLIGAVPEVDVVKVKTAVREYLMPLLSAADFAVLGRMLDQGLIFEETIDQDWNETLQIDDPATAVKDFQPRQFTGNRGFDVGYYRDRVQVTCRLEFSTGPLDLQAKMDLPALMPMWETMIEAAWDNKFSLRNARRTLPIRIDMAYNSGSAHHDVHVGSATNVSWPGYNTANWFYRALNYNHANAPLHEFGHMLGNPDEYNLSPIDYQTTTGKVAATDPNASTEADASGAVRHTDLSSLMGGGATVDRRHLNYFTNWLNSNRLTGEPAYTLI